jgi:hypothetical protein
MIEAVMQMTVQNPAYKFVDTKKARIIDPGFLFLNVGRGWEQGAN